MPACQKHRFCIENLYKNYDFESRGVRERAGGGGRHAKSNDFVLKTLTKATILRAGAAGHPKSNDFLRFSMIFNAEATGGAPRRQSERRLQAICAKSYMPHRHSGSVKQEEATGDLRKVLYASQTLRESPGSVGEFRGARGGGVLRKKGEIWAYW